MKNALQIQRIFFATRGTSVSMWQKKHPPVADAVEYILLGVPSLEKYLC